MHATRPPQRAFVVVLTPTGRDDRPALRQALWNVAKRVARDLAPKIVTGRVSYSAVEGELIILLAGRFYDRLDDAQEQAARLLLAAIDHFKAGKHAA